MLKNISPGRVLVSPRLGSQIRLSLSARLRGAAAEQGFDELLLIDREEATSSIRLNLESNPADVDVEAPKYFLLGEGHEVKSFSPMTHANFRGTGAYEADLPHGNKLVLEIKAQVEIDHIRHTAATFAQVLRHNGSRPGCVIQIRGPGRRIGVKTRAVIFLWENVGDAYSYKPILEHLLECFGQVFYIPAVKHPDVDVPRPPFGTLPGSDRLVRMQGKTARHQRS